MSDDYSMMHTPWRKEFTGPPCRCGIPTPLTEEEKALDKEMLTKAKEDHLKNHQRNLEAYKARRLQQINQNLGY